MTKTAKAPKASKPPQPPKVRLNMHFRNLIINHAKEVIDCPAEREGEEAAHLFALEVIGLQLEKLLPAAEMAVLKKWGEITQVTHVRVPHPQGRGNDNGFNYHLFCLCPRDVRAPVVDTRTGCTNQRSECETSLTVPERVATSSHYVMRSGYYGKELMLYSSYFHEKKALRPEAVAIVEAVHNYELAVRAHDAAREKIIGAIRALVSRSNTLEEVVAVWAPAGELRARMGGIGPLDEEALATIQAATTRAA